MKVIILCGGQGTRLKEETEFRPKPLVQVGGRPILWHIMKIYAHFGFTDYILCLGYKGELIKEYFLNYRAMDSDCTIHLGGKDAIQYHGDHTEENFSVTLANTGENAMTGARIKKVEKYVEDDTVLVTYGDGVADVDIGKVVDFHRKHGKIGTVTSVRPHSRFGRLDLADDGQIRQFAEKPQAEGWISAGFFVFQRKFFDSISADENCVFEQGPLQTLARKGELMAYKHTGFFCPMDTYRDALYLNDLWNRKAAPWASLLS